VNALAGLSDFGITGALRSAPLLRSRAFGPISLRDIAVATGEVPAAAGAPKLEMSAIEASFQDCPLPNLESTVLAIRGALEQVRAIEKVFAENSAGSGPDVSSLVKMIRQAEQLVAPRLEARRAAEAPGDSAGEGAPALNGGPARTSLSGEINSREDVVRALDKICGYYARHEPSSPLPLLLQRCKRLATMSFIDIMRDMVPEGLPQVEIIAGKVDQS